MNPFEWADARSVDEVFALTVKGSAIKAGGVDLVDLMKEGIARPTRLINIRRIPGLDEIREENGGVKIGPLVSLATVAEDPVIRSKYTALALACGKAATPQIRNMATIGGNLLQRPRCWYFRNELFHCRKKGGEICYAQQGENQYHAIFNNGLCAIVHPSAAATPLIAMGATIELSSPKQKRQVPLEEFIIPPMVNLKTENTLGADEILTEIRIPALPPGARSFYLKQGEKESFDWPIAEAAVVLEMEAETCRKASVVLGAAAPTPHRASEAEQVLQGQKIDEAVARKAAQAALKMASPMSKNAYKIPLFETIITRAILAAARGATTGGGEA
ncbi:FAD binding domain-containing protein [Fontivita pretiosa]|uniref:FAD binding domain-containing protein n=1 Tax=Fontivita pretiosa TaxID=2989684 RepID=UPI003D16D1FC